MTTYLEIPQPALPNRLSAAAAIIYEVFLVTLAPVLVIELGLLPVSYRLQVFGLFFIMALVPLLHQEINARSLGLRLDNVRPALPVYAALAAVMTSGALMVITPAIAQLMAPKVTSILSPALYFLLSVPVQQIIYFGYLPARLRQLTKNPAVLTVCIGLLFGMMHAPWQSPLLTASSALVGMVWARVYLRFPNLLLSIGAHALFGGVVLWLLSG